jgi:hypothetical protein
MDPKAEFYDDIITQQPSLTMTSDVIIEFIDEYMNCFNNVIRGSNGLTEGFRGLFKGSTGATTSSIGVTTGSTGATTSSIGATTSSIGATTSSIGATTSSSGIVTRKCNTFLFSQAKADLYQIITNLSNIINNLKGDITNLNNNINAKLEQIDSEKELKGVNSGIFSNINTSNSGAKIMIDDYKTVYNTQYYKNVELVIGVILLLGISAKIFRK